LLVIGKLHIFTEDKFQSTNWNILFYCKKGFKIPQGYSEAVNRYKGQMAKESSKDIENLLQNDKRHTIAI
jgi:hypothetical protein